MYVHIGNGKTLLSRNIIGIFDIENTSVSKITKEYLAMSGKRKAAESVSYDMPKSFVTASEKGKEKVYISPVSAATIKKRINNLNYE